jgi:protein tyrosine/serine phosphatase
MDDEAVLALMSVAPEYISAALDAIRERHGSYDIYMEQVLGVGFAQIAAIRANLLN